MAPRANFACATCATTYELPVAATRCAVCGKKRGFKRLFDTVQVATGRAATVDQLVRPALEQRDRSAAALQQGRPTAIPVQAAYGAIPGDSRMASRNVVMPIVQATKALGGPRPNFVNRE